MNTSPEKSGDLAERLRNYRADEHGWHPAILDDAADEIDRLALCLSEAAFPRWVKVDERPPADGQEVLGCWRGSSALEGMESLVYHAADGPDGPERWEDVFGEPRDTPTHWALVEMPT